MREGWTYKKLGEVGNVVTGSTPSTKDAANYASPDYCFVKPSDLPSTGIAVIDDSEFHISAKAFESARQLPKGSIVVSCIGIIGKVGILNKDACTNQQINAIIPNGTIMLKCLAYTICYKKSELEQIANAPVVPIINKGEFSKFLISVPPISEQQSIVAELDKINELISLKKAQLDDLDTLAQSIFYDMFGDPIENEKGWEMKVMKEVCSKITDGTHDTPTRLTEGVKFITGKHIRPFYIDYDNSDYVTEEVHREIYARCNPEYDDVLYTNIGAGVANAAVNKVQYEFSMKNVALLKLHKEVLSSNYLVYYLNNSNVKNNIIESFSSGGAQVFLSLKAISKILIPLPPLSLQQDFAKRIELIEQQKAQISSTIKDLETLLASRMQYWFD